VAGLAATLGSGAMTNSIDDLKEADVMMVFGSNNTETHPVIGMRLRNSARFRGTKLIVIDPRRTDLVDDSVLWLSPPPGFDLAILNGLAHVILDEGLENRQFIAERTENFDAFRTVVERYTPEYVEKLTAVPKEDLVRAARMYGRAKNAAIVYCMGITQHSKGTDNVKAISNLALLCGQIGKPGSGVNPLRGQNNVQGSCDMGGLPDVYPGYQKVDVTETRQKFEKAWGVTLSARPGLTVVETTHAMIDGKIKALYVMGENPLVTDPDLTHVEKAFGKLDFLVVQDIFLTETAKTADVVLPAAAFAEKNGTFTNTERRVQLLRKALNEPGTARQDWRIIADISTRMGYPMNYGGAEEIFDEMRLVTPQYGGITYKRIGLSGLQWPCPDESHPGTPILHVNTISRGKGLFAAVEHRSSAEVPDDDYPFILTTGRGYYQYHSATMTGKVKLLNDFCPESYLEINPGDAERLGIVDFDWVAVASRRGGVVAKAKITRNVPKGVVFKKFHFLEGAVNRLTNPVLDPTSKIPELKVSAVRVEKYTGPIADLEAQGMCLL
jgi:formate dehydrogenase alpha subunit